MLKQNTEPHDIEVDEEKQGLISKICPITIDEIYQHIMKNLSFILNWKTQGSFFACQPSTPLWRSFFNRFFSSIVSFFYYFAPPFFSLKKKEKRKKH